MQYYATLKEPNSIDTMGRRFYKGTRTPISPEDYETLDGNPRFFLEAIDEVEVAATRTVVVGQSLQPLASQPTMPPNSGKPPRKDLRLKAIQVAAEALDVSNEANFTSDGRPSATALTKILGWQVTSQERDDAMRVYATVKTPEVSDEVKRGGVTIRRRPGSSEPKLLDTGERDLVVLPQTLGENTGSGLDGQAKPRVRSQAEIDAGAADGEGRREVFSASMLRTHENAKLVDRPSQDTVVPTVEDEASSFNRGGTSEDDHKQSQATTQGGVPASPEQQAATAQTAVEQGQEKAKDEGTEGAERV